MGDWKWRADASPLPVHWDTGTEVRGGSIQSMVSPLFHCVSMGYIYG